MSLKSVGDWVDSEVDFNEEEVEKVIGEHTVELEVEESEEEEEEEEEPKE